MWAAHSGLGSFGGMLGDDVTGVDRGETEVGCDVRSLGNRAAKLSPTTDGQSVQLKRV